MKQLYLKCLFIGIFSFLGFKAEAYDCYVGSIFYNLNKTAKTASVTYCDNNYFYYRGSVTIPSTINYNGTTYSVTSIGNYAFKISYDLTSVSIPNSVTSIGTGAFESCSDLTSVILGNGVTSIGSEAFYRCKSLTSITIPNSVTSISSSAFDLCSNLVEVTINCSNVPNCFKGKTCIKKIVLGKSVTSIGNEAFMGCSGLTSITIPNNVTTMGNSAFKNCSGLTSVSIGNGVTGISTSMFENCRGLTSVTIPNSVTSIGNYAFKSCSGLTSITIPNSVTSIGYGAFNYCTSLTSITIPNCVTTIGDNAFNGCNGLTSITIPNSVTSIGKNAFSDCSNLVDVTINCSNVPNCFKGMTCIKNIVLGKSVTSIGYEAFMGCCGLNSIVVVSGNKVYDSRNNCNAIIEMATNTLIIGCKKTIIPNSVTSIGYGAFRDCSDLTSITIPNSVTSIGYSAFEGCSGLTSVTIPNSVTTIGSSAFSGCSSLTSLTIPNSVTNIDNYVFENCRGLTSVTIPNSVTTIGNSAFKNCSGLTSITIPNNVTIISTSAFEGCKAKIKVNKGTKSLLSLWRSGYSAYETDTGDFLPASSLSAVSATQTSVTVTITDYYEGYIYTINGEIVKKGENKTFSGVWPGKSKTLTLRVALDDVSYNKDFSFSSKGIDLRINKRTTSSSISVVGSYTHGDAVVTKEEIYVDGKKVSDDNTGFICGLDPNTEHTIKYSTNFESVSEKVRTASLTLTTSQPKVISAGNVIVEAESNLDDEETNVGFEWRRTDWTSEFPSNTGTAYLYNGTMEGYIRNLNTEKLWKYRPYYTSNAGNTYYGEWVGIDPTNTSYFEPTVHTYASVSVNGNSAEVKGYVQRGTDSVVSKGFAYWKESQGVKSREAMSAPSMISSLPNNAKTVEISGSQQVMTASLSDLEYETTYCYVAFVKTSEGDTFYGDVRSFATGEDLTRIENVEVSSHEQAIEVARYNINGHRINSPQRGINIVRMSDGTTRKVFVK